MTNNDYAVVLYESFMRYMLERGSNQIVIPLLNQMFFKDHPLDESASVKVVHHPKGLPDKRDLPFKGFLIQVLINNKPYNLGFSLDGLL